MAPGALSDTPLVAEFHRGHRVAADDPWAPASSSGGGTGAAAGYAGSSSGKGAALAAVLGVLRAAFLPEAFPESVSDDYLGFQAWDTVQALCSYVRGVLTSQAIMRGVGVGQQAATPLAAVFTFFLRDLAGMAGGVAFAYAEGSSFDSCAKQWRLFADITNDVGMTVELASPFFPRAMFLPIACFGSIARSMTGVAGGATRAALTQHFALRGNAADVSAKEQSQETATTIVGMVLGMAVTRLAADSAAVAWLVFLALTWLHVWANVRALRRLRLASLNQPRLELLVATYLRGGGVLSPQAVAATEDLTPPPFRRLWDWLSGAAARRPVYVHYGSRLRTALGGPRQGGQRGHGSPSQEEAASALSRMLTRQGRRRYLLIPRLASSPSSNSSTASSSGGSSEGAAPAAVAGPWRGAHVHVHVVLHRHAAPADQLRAFVHAHALAAELAHRLRAQGQTPPSQHEQQREERLQQQLDKGDEQEAALLRAAELAAEDWVARRYDPLLASLVAEGWDAGRVALPRPAWTAEWPAAGGAAAGGGGAAADGGAGGGGVHEE